MNFVLMLQLGLVGVVIAGLGIPLVMHKVPLNHWLGFQPHSNQQDSDKWQSLNEYCGKVLLLTGAAIAGLGVGMGVVADLQPVVYKFVAPGVMLIGLVVIITLTRIRQSRM